MKKYSRIKKFETLIRPLSWYIFVLTKARIKVIIQLLRLKPPCLMDICFEAIRLTSCKYPSDRALGITFFNGLNNYIKSLLWFILRLFHYPVSRMERSCSIQKG